MSIPPNDETALREQVRLVTAELREATQRARDLEAECERQIEAAWNEVERLENQQRGLASAVRELYPRELQPQRPFGVGIRG